MSELSSEPGEKEPDPSPQGQDIEGLKQQFEQQQTMIAQLKGMLQSNEQQLVSKEKEVEEYAAKLSGIKSRTKASKRSVKSGSVKKNTEGTVEEKSEGLEDAAKFVEVEAPGHEEEASERKIEKKAGKNIEKFKQGNLILLRKKLEESRIKFEQRGKEMSENKKGIEEMVENLRTQLEERDQVIQTLQKGLENRSAVALAVPSQELGGESQHLSHDVNVTEQMDTREMYAQIVYKDNKIVELNNRIMELEVNVLDLQENLKEKDAVIDARTKAITLMSEDMSRKSKSTLDSLDDTREQMRLMQNNFITLEARMKDEKEQLNRQLEEKDRKLKLLEESHKKLESVRFDLSTRIAELQEKVVHLQTMNTELQKELDQSSKNREHRGDRQDRIDELLRSLDEANKQMLKVKAQHKNKVKSLTKQIESLKKVSESGDEILRLQQRVAELEEDKGNLQLHLVDFDELKATEHRWKKRIEELEERVKQLNHDLDFHVHALSVIEVEKLNLVEDVQSERLQVNQLGNELQTLKSKLTEVENLKVTAEMKAVELEELVDILSREKADIVQENKALSEDRNEYKQHLDALQQEKSELLEEIITLQAQVRESNPGDTDSNRSEFQMVSSSNSDEEKWKRLSASEEALAEEKHVKDSSNIELSVKLLESELDDARKVISEQKDIISDLNLKLETKEEEIEMHQEIISKLEQLGREVGLQEGHVEDVNKLSEILKELNEMTGDLEEWKKRCSEVEDRLKSLEKEKVDLEKRLGEVTDENSLLNSQLRLQKEVSEELVSQLKEGSKIIDEKDNRIKELENVIDQNKNELELSGKELSTLSRREETDVSAIHDETAEHGETKEEELKQSRNMCLKYEREATEKTTELLHLRKDLEEKDNVLRNLEQKIQEMDESSLTFLQELRNKDSLLEQVRNECMYLKDNLEKQRSPTEEGSLHSDKEALEHLEKIRELELLLENQKHLSTQKENELEKSVQKVKTLTEKVKKLAVNLKAKAVVVQNHEEKEKKYLETIKEKEVVVSNLILEKEKLCHEFESLRSLCEEKDKHILSLSEKLGSDILSQESKILELSQQNKQLTEINETVQNSIQEQFNEKLVAEHKSHEERQHMLTCQIVELEKELNDLRTVLRSQNDEVIFLKDQCKQLCVLEEEKKLIEESKALSDKKNQELIGEIMMKEDELTEVSLKLDELSKSIEIKSEQIEASSVRFKELEQIIVAKDMQISALEDRTSGFQNSWSALEAKLQEREAFIESLEQELAKRHSYQQHLEEGLSFIEERRRSLETKYAALGEQLQESDRIKEEAEEHEGLLENRLAALVSSEEILRKRLEDLTGQNTELSQKISELAVENEDLKKHVANFDNNFKNANKEIERLVSCEMSYQQALERIEKLEGEMRRCTMEFERSYKEKEQEACQCVENLELDMKNLNKQLEVLENEKRSLMEYCEKLNDTKMNLEEDIEAWQEKAESYQIKALDLESIIDQKETELNSLSIEKQKEISELKQKVQMLEKLQKESDISPNIETKHVGLQITDDSSGSDDIHQLKLEMENMTALLAQKESEVQSYQSRLLQLQFSGGGGSYLVSEAHEKEQAELMRVNQLENVAKEMQEKLKHKDSQLEELRDLLETTNSEMSNLQSQLASSCRKIEEMSCEMCHLHEIVESKDNLLQLQMEKISDITSSSRLSEQLEYMNTDYQNQLSALLHENSHLQQELVKEKANNVVCDVLSLAEKHVHDLKQHEIKSIAHQESQRSTVRFEDNVEFCKTRRKVEDQAVDLQCVQTGSDSFALHDISTTGRSKTEFPGQEVMNENNIVESEDTQGALPLPADANTTQELVEKLGDLRAELDVVKNERQSALIKVEQLELEVNRLLDVEKQLNDLQDRLNDFSIGQGTTFVGSEHFSKESSVDSECTSDIRDAVSCVDEIHITPTKVSEYRSVGQVVIEQKDSAHKPSEHSEPVDLGDAAWGGEVLIEEGWGWGAEEARLEEEHMQKQQAALCATPSGDQLQQHVLDLENKIDLLEKEKNRIIDDLKASQVRSGKMLKKLKDLKTKNESLMRENQELTSKKSSDFGSLDLAIEEELKIRIDSVEKELKECKGERDTAKIEKEGLQKRIEVLSAANERLSEREQGMDIEFWQNKNKELMNQVESLQWQIEELVDEKSAKTEGKDRFSDWDAPDNSSNKLANLQELQEQVTALAADNEQLQNILEEQRNLRVAAEASLKDLQQFTSSKEANLLQQESVMKEEYMNLRESYEIVCKEVELLRSHTGQDSLIAENAALRENYDVLYREFQQMRSNSDSDIIAAEYSSMRKNYETMYNEMEQLRSQVDISNTLQANYESLQMAHDKLINDMNNMQKEYCDLTHKYETIERERSVVEEECSEKTKTMHENYNRIINQLQDEKAELCKRYDEVLGKHTELSVELQLSRDEMKEFQELVSSMEQEQERLSQVNLELNEKYESLKHSDSMLSGGALNQGTINSPFDMPFGPVQLFSPVDKETTTDEVRKTSVSIQCQSENDGNSVENQLKACHLKIAELKQEIEQKVNEITILREMFASEQQEWANIEQELNQKITILQGELDNIKDAANRESEVRECLMVKEHELSNIKSQLSYLEETLSKAQYKVEDLESQLVQKEEEIQSSSRNAENQENMIQQVIASKEQELKTLHETLAIKEHEQYKLSLGKENDIENLKLQIEELETHIQNLTITKDEDLQNLKIQLSEMEKKMKTLETDKEEEMEKLKDQLSESSMQVQNLSQVLQEKEQQIIELQEVLEAREDEIREAVIQIRDRNIEIQRLKQVSGVITGDTTSTETIAQKEAQIENQQESSQQNELDLALYMLHQRDVRCEELTLELMQLLEERDTLQLRLSTAIRINEELRNKITKGSATSTPVRVPAARSTSDASSSSADLGEFSGTIITPIEPEPVTGTTVEEPLEDLRVLADKLSQLHSVDYRRDVTLQDEREQRHSEQVMLLQQRNPGVLVESNYTLSRDVQSPSTVLLNWIWGRSTPKVMHI